MKSRIIAVFIILSISSFPLQAKKLQALFNYCTFNTPDKGPYVETYLSVNGQSVNYVKNANGKWQGAIEITLIFKKDSTIKYADKYILLSPEQVDSTSQFSFIDQQRVPLLQGTYDFEIQIADKNSKNKPFISTDKIKVDFPEALVTISDIEMLDSYSKSTTPSKITKSGYDLIPYPSEFFPKDIRSLRFYAEIYNADKFAGGASFLLRYFIENANKHTIIDQYSRFVKQNAEKVNVILDEFAIDKLGSGNYNLIIEAVNKENKILARKEEFFQRSNSFEIIENDSLMAALDINNTFVSLINNEDSLRDCLLSLRPISTTFETNFAASLVKSADLAIMQKYLYGFWLKRDMNNPEQAWNEYHAQVLVVNEIYKSGRTKGYDTDRGRVYLQYGKPSSIAKEDNDRAAYPFEIWQYYKLKNQSNRKFIFCNSNLVNNDFKLIHSDAVGEIYNNRWQLEVYGKALQNNDVDVKNPSFIDSNKARDLFNNPH